MFIHPMCKAIEFAYMYVSDFPQNREISLQTWFGVWSNKPTTACSTDEYGGCPKLVFFFWGSLYGSFQYVRVYIGSLSWEVTICPGLKLKAVGWPQSSSCVSF